MRMHEQVAEVLDRHPGAALTSEELQERLAREFPGGIPRPLSLSRPGEGSAAVRVIEAPKRRWCSALRPPIWVIGSEQRRGGDLPRRSLPGRLRRSLRSLSGAVDPDSAAAWARWNRLLEEEPALRRVLERSPGRSEQGGEFPDGVSRPSSR